MVAEATVATVETTAAVAEPVMATLTINPKKVAFVAGGILVIGASAYVTKRILDKRKAAKSNEMVSPLIIEKAAIIDGEELEPELVEAK